MGKTNLKNILPSCAFLVLLFITSLEGLTDNAVLQKILKHIDEFLVLGCMAYLVLHIHYVFRKKRALLWCWLGFLAIGAVSGVVYRYQALIPSVMDAVVIISKFMVGYLTAYVYARLHPGNLADQVAGVTRITTLLFFVIAVHDILLSPFFPKGDYRYFADSLILMFSHQTYLAAAMATLLILLGYTDKNHKNIPYMLMASFVGMMTLRGKAIAFFLVYWVMYICFLIFRNRHYLALLVAGGIGCVIVAFGQITEYFLDNTRYSPRQILLRDSIALAAKHFPLGTGFGSFGSTIADQYYSPLYLELGYDNNYGMGPADSMFLSDSFWPEIIAQFGFIGFVLFLAVVVCFLVAALRKMRVHRQGGFAMLAILLNMLINSMAESSFFNPTSFLLFMIFGICEAKNHPVKTLGEKAP